MAYFYLGSVLYFFVAAGFNFWQAFRKIGPFTNKGQIGSSNGMRIGIKEFIQDFNEYLEGVNVVNFKTNIVSMGVNLFSGIASLIAAGTTAGYV